MKQTVDPYGTEGFTCETCLKEISNVYYHCLACELILKKDFNVCMDCAQENLHEVNTLPAISSLKGHFGSIDWSAAQRSGQMCSHRAKSCRLCGFCVKCSCRCHTVRSESGNNVFVCLFVFFLLLSQHLLSPLASLSSAGTSKTISIRRSK